MHKRFALLAFAATLSSIAIPRATLADGVPELEYFHGTWSCFTAIGSKVVQQFVVSGDTLQSADVYGGPLTRGGYVDVYRNGPSGTLTVDSRASGSQGVFYGESRGWEGDTLAFTGAYAAPNAQGLERRMTYQRYGNDRFTRVFETQVRDTWLGSSFAACERVAPGADPSQHVVKPWFSGPLDSLIGAWKCGSYAIVATRIAHAVILGHLKSPDGKTLAVSNIELDDTDSGKITAKGLLDNWTFAALSKAKSAEGWIFYGPAENGSDETSFKLVIRQTDRAQFDETAQRLQATSSTDPGSWKTLLAGSCSRLRTP